MKVKGLFLKEVYAQKTSLIIWSIAFVAFFAAAIISDKTWHMMIFYCLMTSMAGLNSLSLDERGWGKYAYGLPCSSKEIILSKYIFDFIWRFGTLSLLIIGRMIGSFIFDFKFLSEKCAFGLALAFAFYTVVYFLFPMYFKWGSKVAVALCTTIGFAAGISVNLMGLNDKIPINIGVVPVIISLCVLLVSIPVTYHITVKLYEKQELD
jgi:hypothetical protein